MSSRKKNKKPSLAEWCSADPSNRHFAKVDKSTLSHPKFNELNYTTQIIYVRMLVACLGNREFCFPFETYGYKINKGTFYKCIHELENKGFISIIYNGMNQRTVSRYRFERKWKDTS